MRLRRAAAAAVLVLAGGAALGAYCAARAIERRVTAMVRAQGAPLGLSVETVWFSWTAPLRLGHLALAPKGGERLTIEEAGIGWSLHGGDDPRAHVRRVSLRGVRLERGGLVVEWPSADLDVVAWERGAGQERIQVRQRPSGGTLDARVRKEESARETSVALDDFDLSGARVRWSAEPLAALGVWTGRLTLSQVPGRLATDGALSARAVRFAFPRELGLGSGDYGTPTAVSLAWAGARDGESVEVHRLAARVGGLELEGHGHLDGAGDRLVALVVSARTDLGAAFQTAALELPPALPVAPTDRLGTASFDVTVEGPLAHPAFLRIVPHLRFDSTPQVAEKLEFLRRPFRFRPPDAEGVTLDVREGAADFIPLGRVPPLFLRALLISEDAGFYGHPGVDVAEIPVAWAANVERGTPARGASTITQQLVKNLFLSRDKSYGRKLEEAALALLVDAAVPKWRLLEIYVNVIEWGPSLFGLVPAARHYFGKAPADLSPKEMAFLVCLIPSPVRYHQAHVTGHLGPGMEQLVSNLLAKLRSVDAIDEGQYREALAEELQFRPESASGDALATGTD
jgi:penicillin-binding protein 1A